MIIKNKEQFETTVDKISRNKLSLQELLDQRDAAIQALRDEWDEEISPLQDRLQTLTGEAEDYARENRDDLLGEARSRKTPLATFGFRKRSPRLMTLARAKWFKIVQNAKKHGLLQFIETEEVINKIKVKSEATPEQLKQLGCRILSGESFYIKPKDPGSVEANQSAA